MFGLHPPFAHFVARRWSRAVSGRALDRAPPWRMGSPPPQGNPPAFGDPGDFIEQTVDQSHLTLNLTVDLSIKGSEPEALSYSWGSTNPETDWLIV